MSLHDQPRTIMRGVHVHITLVNRACAAAGCLPCPLLNNV